MKQKAYGECDCGNWGEAPAHFTERKHFLKCTCGKPMYLIYSDPREAGRRDAQKVVVGTMDHGEKM